MLKILPISRYKEYSCKHKKGPFHLINRWIRQRVQGFTGPPIVWMHIEWALLTAVSQALRLTPLDSRGARHHPWRPGVKTGMQVLCCFPVVVACLRFLLLKYIILTYFESLCQQNSNQSIVLASRKRLTSKKGSPMYLCSFTGAHWSHVSFLWVPVLILLKAKCGCVCNRYSYFKSILQRKKNEENVCLLHLYWRI